MSDNDIIARRFRQVRQELCHGSNTEFAQRIGKSRQHASALCNGKIGIGKQTLNLILRTFPTVNPEWLFFGSGSMLSVHQAAPLDRAALLSDISDTFAHLAVQFNALASCVNKSE